MLEIVLECSSTLCEYTKNDGKHISKIIDRPCLYALGKERRPKEILGMEDLDQKLEFPGPESRFHARRHKSLIRRHFRGNKDLVPLVACELGVMGRRNHGLQPSDKVSVRV
jgi:hypothetical protein